MKHHQLRFHNAIVWRYPNAPLDLATALGQIAADLWVAGRLAWFEGAFVVRAEPPTRAHHDSDLFVPPQYADRPRCHQSPGVSAEPSLTSVSVSDSSNTTGSSSSSSHCCSRS